MFQLSTEERGTVQLKLYDSILHLMDAEYLSEVHLTSLYFI